MFDNSNSSLGDISREWKEKADVALKESLAQLSQGKDRNEQGMFTMPLLDTLIREQKWICPIHMKKSDSALWVAHKSDKSKCGCALA